MDLMSLAEMHQRPEDPYLPPGFRFHPTDEELVYYLRRKVLFNSFRISAITEVDLNKCEPWDLPAKAAMGEKEWYFYTLRDRKYPTGMRTNRATEAGYWKATGKDRNVMSSATSGLVGMKKTLVFYRGRAPKGIKSNWIMHEYRLEGEASSLSRSIKMPKDAEWVVCRIFQKLPGGKAGRDPSKKATLHIPSEQHHSSSLPALMEESTRVTVTEEAAESDSSHNDQLPSLSGNSYSVPKEQPSNWILEDSAPAATSSANTSAILRQNRPLVPDVLKVSPAFLGCQSNSLPVTLDHPFGSYGSSSFVKYTPPRSLDFPHIQQQQHEPADISSLKALDQFSKALAGPFSVAKPGIRACKVEPRAPVYPSSFRSWDTSAAGWLSDAQNLSAYTNPQQQLQNFSSGSGAAEVPSNVYRDPAPTSSAADIEPLWNY